MFVDIDPEVLAAIAPQPTIYPWPEISSDLAKALAPPTLDELRSRWGLTDREAARVFECHDPGDEAPRPYGRWTRTDFRRTTDRVKLPSVYIYSPSLTLPAFRVPTFEEQWFAAQLHDLRSDRYERDPRAPNGLRYVHDCESCHLEHDPGDEG